MCFEQAALEGADLCVPAAPPNKERNLVFDLQLCSYDDEDKEEGSSARILLVAAQSLGDRFQPVLS